MNKLIFSLLLFCFIAAQAQYKKPFFNTLSIQSGLPEANVQSTLEDKNGYLWMGTQNGLVRYDGYQFKPYLMLNRKGVQIPSNSVNYLHEGKNGKIWACTMDDGIYMYNPHTDRFDGLINDEWSGDSLKTRIVVSWIDDKDENHSWILLLRYVPNKFNLYRFSKLDNSLEQFGPNEKGGNYLLINDNVNIDKDINGIIWLQSDSLVSYFDEKEQSFKPFFALPKSLKGSLIYSISCDPTHSDILWLNTYSSTDIQHYKVELLGKNIIKLNTQTKDYKIISPDSKNRKAIASNCKAILKDSLNRVWFSTEKGVSLFNYKTNDFTNFNIDYPKDNPYPYARGMASDKDGNLWIGGRFKGIYYLNTNSGVATYYPSNKEEGSLPDLGYASNLFFDRYGTLWINMPWSGIAYLYSKKSLFTIQSAPSFGKSKDGNFNTSNLKIVGSQGDSICFLADNSNLFSWKSKTNQFTKIDLKAKDACKNIAKVISTTDGNLWIGTYDQGLFSYHPKTRRVINYKNNPKDTNSIASNYISKLVADKNETIWIGTYGSGLCSFNTKTQHFTSYPFILNDNSLKPINKLDDDEVSSMLIDDRGILWIGTNNGALNRFDTETQKFTSFCNNDQGFYCVISLLEDSKKRFWVGTYLSGLFLFDRNTGEIKRYSEQEGLLHNEVSALHEDAMGNMWCVSQRGLSRLNPQNGQITVFDKLTNKLEGSSSRNTYTDADGNFYISLTRGLLIFNPNQVKANPVPPSVVIETIRYQPANSGFGKDTVLYTQANENITLKYKENKIGFQYVALHYADAEKNQYAFQLEGYDMGWVRAGTQRSTTYTNLSPGKYTFKVKASNSDGVWNEKGSSISIVILPPWWLTWWAYSFYVLLLILTLWAIIRYQRNRTMRIERDKSQKRELEHAKEIEKAYAELKSTQAQLIQSEKMASLGELTAGIAHEIQNPLNFVNNFSEVNTELIDEMQHEMDKGNLADAKAISNDIRENEQKINHHGKRADAIVKGMLQHSRISSGKKESTNINALADEYFRLAYHGLRAKDKSFNATMKTDFDEAIGNINVIPQDIGRVILNLINNSFYAVTERKHQLPDGYEPTVSVSTKKIDGKYLISVKDNGNGIPQKVLDKIFQPFFTTKPSGKGTGLGLSMSYEIVAKEHGGELKVNSKEGEGAEFTIVLPG